MEATALVAEQVTLNSLVQNLVYASGTVGAIIVVVGLLLIEAYERDFGIPVVHAWGMTETAPLGSVAKLKSNAKSLGEDERYRLRSLQGMAPPGLEMRIAGDDGAELPWDGEAVGEVQVRGPWVAGSYYESPDSGTRFTEDGWFKTGDVATMDPSGFMQITDRTKDLIKSGGEWISSVELENAVMAHDAVRECAVIAVPDEKWAERPMAVVVPVEGAGELTLDELHDHLRDRVAGWWLPDHLAFLTELPKTSVGKFDKKVLRAMLADGTLAPSLSGGGGGEAVGAS